jgi:Flp pilus assembly pilin Flp
MTTKTDRKTAWEAVADRLDALGLKLKVHFEEAGGQVKEVNDAFERLGSAIEATFSAIGAAVQDPAVREDANNLAATLGDALADTLSHAGQELEVAAKGLRCHRAEIPGATPKEPADKS